MNMKAAVLYEINKPLVVEDIKIPELKIGQVLVKISYSGVCHKQVEDIHGKSGHDPYLPHLLGHEGAGVVEAIGPGVTHVAQGDHVVLSWIKGAGIDAKPPIYFKGSKPINAGQVTTFNEYTVASENRVTKIRKDMPLDKAALLGCAVPTGIGAVINESKVETGSSVAVFGAGGIGLNIIQGAALVNALKIIAVDLLDHKLDFARKFGATHVINAKEGDPVEKIKELTDGKGVDYAFESIGHVETMEQAYQSACNNGIVNLVGNPRPDEKIRINAVQTHYGKCLRGGHGGSTRPERDFPRYVDLYLVGKLKLDELITHSFILEKVNDALQLLEKGVVGRAIIDFGVSSSEHDLER